MKKLFLIFALTIASIIAADAQCIKFKLSGADTQGAPTYNAIGDSIIFQVSIVTYVEKIGVGKFEKVDNAKFAFPLPFGFTPEQLNDAVAVKAAAWIKKTYPDIN